MWKCLAFIAILLALTDKSLMFNILRDHVPTDRMEFCDGERITFVCTKQSTVIAWTAPPIMTGEILVLSLSANFVSMPPFNATNLPGRNSTLTVDVFSQLDGINISCFDRASTGALLSTTIVQVLGIPSNPMVNVILNGVTSLNLTISKPSESAECVQNYITTVTSTGLTDPLVSMVNALDSTPAFDTITNLSMCKYNYTVNVVAVDLAGNWSQSFVSMPRITLKDIFVSKERNSTVQPNGVVSISFEIAISDCHTSTLEFFFINLNSKESRSMKRGINESSLVNFTQWISDTQYICVINIVLPSNHRVEVDSFNCSTNVSTVTISPTVLTTCSLSIGAIIGIAVVATVAVGVFIFIFLGCVLFSVCKEAKNRKESIGRKGNVEELDSKIADNVSHSSSKDGSVSEDHTPTYQAPETIQRQAAGPTGDLYTLVATKGNKGSKKAKKEEELPVYSVVDKNKKNEEDKLVYTLIDVQNPIPPGITQPYVVEPVVYSTLQ